MTEFDPTHQTSTIDSYTKEDYLRMIEAGRDILDDYQIGILFALYEEDDVATACQELNISESWLQQVMKLIVRLVKNNPNQYCQNQRYLT